MMKYRHIIFVISSLQIGTILAEKLAYDQTPNFERVDK